MNTTFQKRKWAQHTDFDDNAWRVGAGLRYYGPSFSGSLELESEEGRDDFNSTSVIFSIRSDF